MAARVIPIRNDPQQMTEHHVPPRSRGKTEFILPKTRVQHEAYHTLFANAGSYEEAALILLQKWWRPYGAK